MKVRFKAHSQFKKKRKAVDDVTHNEGEIKIECFYTRKAS